MHGTRPQAGAQFVLAARAQGTETPRAASGRVRANLRLIRLGAATARRPLRRHLLSVVTLAAIPRRQTTTCVDCRQASLVLTVACRTIFAVCRPLVGRQGARRPGAATLARTTEGHRWPARRQHDLSPNRRPTHSKRPRTSVYGKLRAPDWSRDGLLVESASRVGKTIVKLDALRPTNNHAVCSLFVRRRRVGGTARRRHGVATVHSRRLCALHGPILRNCYNCCVITIATGAPISLVTRDTCAQ